MPSIDTDTRLVMTVLFVGAISGINVYFFSQYGSTFVNAYGPYPVAVIFGVLTVGGIMILKALFDLILNDYIEDFLLRRAIDGYWGRKQREEENKRRVKESLKQFNTNYAVTPALYGDQNLPTIKAEEQGVSPSFLTIENQ